MSKYSTVRRANSVSRRTPSQLNQSFDLSFHKRDRDNSLDRHNTSINTSINTSVLSDKIPITFTSSGIDIKPMQIKSIEHESKLGLYSEIERLSVLNYELKRQNESYARETEQVRFKANQVPILESQLSDAQRDIARKDTSISKLLMEVENLKVDNMNLARLEPAYSEVLTHNKQLVNENEKLLGIIEDANRIKAKLEGEIERIRIVEIHNREANRKIDLLSEEILDRNKNIETLERTILEIRRNYENEITDLNGKVIEIRKAYEFDIDDLARKNRSLENENSEIENELDHLKRRYEDTLKNNHEHLSDLLKQQERDKKVALDVERSDLTSKFNYEKARLESAINDGERQIGELQKKLTLVLNELENLQHVNADKQNEIENLRDREFKLEQEIEHIKQLKEDEKRQAIEQQTKEFGYQLAESRMQGDDKLFEQRRNYEDRISQLREEVEVLERLKDVVREKERDIEGLKNQNIANDKSWERKLTQAVDNENKQLTTKHLNERNRLEAEIISNRDRILELENQLTVMTMEVERLTNLHQEKNVEIEELRIQMANLHTNSRIALEEQKGKLEYEKKREIEQIHLEMAKAHDAQYDMWKDKQSDIEKKLYNFSNENVKLTNLADERGREIEILRFKLQSNEEKHSQQITEMEKRHEINLRLSIEKEVNNLISKHNNETASLENKIFELNQAVSQAETKNHYYEGEMERLNSLLLRKQEEINEERKRYSNLEAQRSQDILAIRQQFEAYKKANIDVSTLQVRFEAERSSLNSQIYQHKEKIQELEKRMGLLLGENEKIRLLYTERSNDLDNLRRKYAELEEKYETDKQALENQIETLRHSNLDVQEVSIKFQSEKAQAENQIKQLKTYNENTKLELEKLYELMNQRKKEYEATTKQNEELKRQLEKVTNQLRHFDTESSAKKERYEGLIRNYEEIEKERDLYRSQADRLNNELNKTHIELNAKIREVDLLKGKYEKSMEISSQLNSQLMSKLMRNE